MANTGFSSVGHLGWCQWGMLSPDLWACYSYSGGVAGPGSKHQHIDQMCFKFIDQAEVLPIATGLWQGKLSRFSKESSLWRGGAAFHLANQNLKTVLTISVLQFHDGIYADSETDAYGSLRDWLTTPFFLQDKSDSLGCFHILKHLNTVLQLPSF